MNRSLMKLAAAQVTPLEQWGAAKDPQDTANKELVSNQGDQRKELGDLFESGKKVQKVDSADTKKLLPIAGKASTTTSSNPLLKVALHQTFFHGVRSTGIMKEAAPNYLRTAYAAFEDEVSKIAMPTTVSLGKAFKGKRPGLVSPAAVPSSWGPGAVIKSGA